MPPIDTARALLAEARSLLIDVVPARELSARIDAWLATPPPTPTPELPPEVRAQLAVDVRALAARIVAGQTADGRHFDMPNARELALATALQQAEQALADCQRELRLQQPTIELPDKHPLRIRAEQAESALATALQQADAALAAERERREAAERRNNARLLWQLIVSGVADLTGVTYDSPSDVIDCVRALLADAELFREKHKQAEADLAAERERREAAELALSKTNANMEAMERDLYLKLGEAEADCEALRARMGELTDLASVETGRRMEVERWEANQRARATKAEADCNTLRTRVAALEWALREAWPYVPDHHGPVQHRIKAALSPQPGEGAAR